MNIYQARQRNAVRWAVAINEAIDHGCIVLDKGGQQVKSRFSIDENGDVFQKIELPGNVIYYRYFLNDPKYDNGCHTSIRDFDEIFKDWKIIDPKYYRNLKKGR